MVLKDNGFKEWRLNSFHEFVRAVAQRGVKRGLR
jgi:hypothetical protein